MKSKFLRLITLLVVLVLCFISLFSGCTEQKEPPVQAPTESPISGLTTQIPQPEKKGEHYDENMAIFGDFIKNVYEYECVYQFYKNSDKVTAFSKVVELKKMVLSAINRDFFLKDTEKTAIEKNAESHLNMKFDTLSLNCEQTPDAIAKEVFGITFEQYKTLRLCESLAEKCRKQIIEDYLIKDINENEIKAFYDADKNTYDYAVLRYITYRLKPGDSHSENQSKTKSAERLCSKLKTVEDMLDIIGGESDKQSEGNSHGQITVYMNQTDSLYYEFLEEGGTELNSKTVVHDKNNAYVVMCEGYYTWENSDDVKNAVKEAYAARLAEKEMIAGVDLQYGEPEDWYKMSGIDEITAAKNNDDYSSVLNKLDVASKADTLFLTIQEPGNTTACKFYAYEKQNEGWQQVFKTTGYVGRSGVADPKNRVEGNGTTPSGVYSFGMLFGIKDNPGGLQKDYKKVDNDDYWDGDRYSDTYNQYVKGSEMPSSWNRNASEHLIDYKYSYNYGVMVNYNVNPTIKGKGSAIFLHCTRPGALSSAGCISIPEDKMIKSLRMIDDNAYIVIVKDDEDISKFYSK